MRENTSDEPCAASFSGLTLFVPGLLLPVEILTATTFDLTAPALSLILGRGRRVEITAEMPAALFALERLPVAALRKSRRWEGGRGRLALPRSGALAHRRTRRDSRRSEASGPHR
jgi:hypothetical protein